MFAPFFHGRSVLVRALGGVNRRSGFFLWLVGIRADGDGPGERFQGEDDPRLEFRGHRFRVELEILHVAFGKLGSQQTDGGELLAGKIEVEAGLLQGKVAWKSQTRASLNRARNDQG